MGRKVMFFISLILILPIISLAGGKIVGAYKQLPGAEFYYDGEKVDVLEFMSFYCGHCYMFEREIPVIKKAFPGKIRWKALPIFWGQMSPKPSEAYLLAVDAGKGEEMKRELFKAYFEEKRDITKIETIEEIGKKIGLGSEFIQKLREGAKKQEVEQALDLMKKYRVHETPTLIIAGNIMTSPDMVNEKIDLFRDNVIIIINSLIRSYSKK